MKKYLISPEQNQYKANMHGHSRLSDGKLTLEQLKEGYKERGYSVYAFSDHTTVRWHKELTDENFLPLAAAEIDVSQQGAENFNLRKSFHFNIIARDPEHFEQVPYDNKNYSIQYINSLIAEARAKNYFVVANHPNWSLFTEDEYLQIEGLNGFELYNCITANYGGALSFTPEIYLYLLRNGKRIYPIGADDNHSFCLPFSHPNNDSFGGFTYILADKLEYGGVINALDRGDCYCSMGPQIHEFSIEDDVVHVKTSPAKRITVMTGTRHLTTLPALRGETVEEFTGRLNMNLLGGFILLHVEDSEGKHAMTRAYYQGEDF
ncbi:MAG: hypothetical protein IJ493_13370 [Clostridia bacterium]|nr:hypothetical protein [Clostridia bacterium]